MQRKRRVEQARYHRAFPFLAGEIRSRPGLRNSLHEGEDLSRSVRLPRLSVNTEESRVGLHYRLKCTDSRTYAKRG